MYIIDKTGQLVYMGGIDDKPGKDEAEIATSKNYVTAALDAMAAGKSIEDKITRPYGCSVKSQWPLRSMVTAWLHTCRPSTGT